MPWYSTWSGTWPGQTKDGVWKSNMNDERIITLEDMPGWDKYTANTTPDTSATKPDTSITKPDTSTISIATKPRMAGTATTIGIFDRNGHYLGVTTQGLPQGRYVVRKKIQGHTVNMVYFKK